MIVIGADVHKRTHALAAVDAATGSSSPGPQSSRQLNRSLHVIAITRGGVDPQTRAYLARKEAEGKTRIEPMGCLSATSRAATTGYFKAQRLNRRGATLDPQRTLLRLSRRCHDHSHILWSLRGPRQNLYRPLSGLAGLQVRR
jgi:hypothetical protein